MVGRAPLAARGAPLVEPPSAERPSLGPGVRTSSTIGTMAWLYTFSWCESGPNT
jgi:hypothetical protein